MQDGTFHTDIEDPKPKKKAKEVKSWGEKTTTTAPVKKAVEVADWDEEVVVASEPVKKKEETIFSTFSNAAKTISKVGEIAKETKPIVEPEPAFDISEYNKQFETATGHREFGLSEPTKPTGMLSQDVYEKRKKGHEEKKYLKYRDIEEKEIQPVAASVETGTLKPGELSSLYNKPYGKRIVGDIINEITPEAEVVNEQDWDKITTAINVKNRPKGVETQNQYIYNLDNEIYKDVDGLQGESVFVSGGTGGAAANVSKFTFPKIDTNNAAELGSILSQIENADTLTGKDGKQVDKEDLVKKINEKLFYISSQQPIHSEIISIADKTKEALTRVNIDRERGENIPIEKFAKDDAVTQKHFELGLNFVKDARPGTYINVVRGITERGKVSDLDFESLSNIGQQIYNQKLFREGAVDPEAIGKETEIKYDSYQTKKADYSKILSEEIKDLGYKNRLKIPQSVIDQAAVLHPELTNKEIINDIKLDEANGGYGIVKGGGLNALFRGIAAPIKGINSTVNAIFDSPVDNYLNSKRLDYGDQNIADDKGQISGELPSERNNIFNDILEGTGQFIPQVLLAKGIGRVIKAPYGAIKRSAVTSAEASNIAAYPGTFISTFIQSYGDGYTDMLQKTGDVGRAKLVGAIDGTSAALFEMILPDTKIAEKMGGILNGAKDNFAQNIIKLVEKGGTKEAARPLVRDFVTNVLGIVEKEVVEEDGTAIVDYMTEALFSPATVQDRDLAKELWETTKQTALSMIIPAVLGGGGQAKQNQPFTIQGLNQAAINFNEYKETLDKGLEDKTISQEDYNDALKVLGTHRQSINTSPRVDANGEVMPDKKRLDYAYQETLRKINQDKAEKQTDPIQKKFYEDKAKEADKIKKEMFYKEEVKPEAAAIQEIKKENDQWKANIVAIEERTDISDEEKEKLKQSEDTRHAEEVAKLQKPDASAANPDQELFNQINEKADEGYKATLKAGDVNSGLGYMEDKFSENPVKFRNDFGDDITDKVMERTSTEKLKAGIDYLIENVPDSQSIPVLDKLIAEREPVSQPTGKEVQAGVWYHGSPTEGISGNELKPNKNGLIFFTRDKNIAERYATNDYEGNTPSKNVFERKLQAKNVFDPEKNTDNSEVVDLLARTGNFEKAGRNADYDALAKQALEDGEWSVLETKEFIDGLKKLGYDGIFIDNRPHYAENAEGNRTFNRDIAVFDTKQHQSIEKSATKEVQAEVPTVGEGQLSENAQKAWDKFYGGAEYMKKEKPTEGVVPIENFGKNIIASQGTGEESIKTWEDKIKNGERPYVIIQKDSGKNDLFRVVDGHHKLKAYQRLGIKEIPTIDTGINGKYNFEQPNTVVPESKTIPVEGKAKEKKETQKEKISKIEDLQEPRDKVLAYFGNGGKIHPSAITELYGGKDPRLHAKTSPEGERKARIGLLANSAPNIERLAERFLEDNPNQRYTVDQFRNAIEDVLKDHISGGSAAKELIDKYTQKSVEQELTNEEAKEMNDVAIAKRIKIVEELPESQQNDLLQLIEKYEDKYGNVDWERLEKDTNGFSPDILSLPIETQKALDGIIQKNISEAESESRNATNKDGIGSEKEGTEKAVDETATTNGEANTKNQQGDQSSKKEIPTMGEAKEGEPPTGETKKGFSSKARELAAKIRKDGLNAALPDWAKADLPEGTKAAGFGGKSLDNAIAKAIELVADAVDAGVKIADAIQTGFQHIKDYYAKEGQPFNEQKVKEGFEKDMTAMFEKEAKAEIKAKRKEVIQLRKALKDIDVYSRSGLDKAQVEEIFKKQNLLTPKVQQLIDNVFSKLEQKPGTKQFEKAQEESKVKEGQKILDEIFSKIRNGQKVPRTFVRISTSDAADLIPYLKDKYSAYKAISLNQLEEVADSLIDIFGLDVARDMIQQLNINEKPIAMAKVAMKLREEGRNQEAAMVMADLIQTGTATGQAVSSFQRVKELIGSVNDPTFRTEFQKAMYERMQAERKAAEAEFGLQSDVFKGKISDMEKQLHEKTIKDNKSLFSKLIDRICGTRKRK